MFLDIQILGVSPAQGSLKRLIAAGATPSGQYVEKRSVIFIIVHGP